MRVALLLLFFTGLFLLFANQLFADRPPEVRMVYVPRDLDTYLREEPEALTTFDTMFSEAGVSPQDYDARTLA